MEVRQITPNDHEAVIVIKGEWDREDLKNILDDLFSTTRREVLEEVENWSRQFPHETFCELMGDHFKKCGRCYLADLLQSLKDK